MGMGNMVLDGGSVPPMGRALLRDDARILWITHYSSVTWPVLKLMWATFFLKSEAAKFLLTLTLRVDVFFFRMAPE